MIESWTYRRDRVGERWHIVPAGEHGVKGRALCGEPRQGTRLSEGHSTTEPRSADALCPQCATQGPAAGIAVWDAAASLGNTRPRT